jgi:hypothetical protein
MELERGQAEIETDNTIIQPREPYPYDFRIKAGWSGHPFHPRPESYRLRVTANYEVKGKVCFASEIIDLSLFPSFGSMLSGTLARSLLGTIVRNAETIARFPMLSTQTQIIEEIMGIFIVPLIFGLVAGLILMRKKDVQPFLTIEDFWGGIVVGFVVGYGGSDIVTRILSTDLGTASNQTSGT